MRAEHEQKSSWNAVICTVLFLLPVLYWLSAPVTLWAWKETIYTPPAPSPPTPGSGIVVCYFYPLHPPELWCTLYEPVLRAAEDNTLRAATLKPFEWLEVDGTVEGELYKRRLSKP